MLTGHAVRGAILFAAAGALNRFTFRYFETRWEIVIFSGAALVYQFVARPAFGKRVSPVSASLDIACITAAIVATKVAIEGHL